MGVRYIQAWTPKSTRTVRSRYLVVILEIMIPKPIPRIPRCTSSRGMSTQAAQLGDTRPFTRK